MLTFFRVLGFYGFTGFLGGLGFRVLLFCATNARNAMQNPRRFPSMHLRYLNVRPYVAVRVVPYFTGPVKAFDVSALRPRAAEGARADFLLARIARN